MSREARPWKGPVSIVVPAYNEEAGIEAAVDALRAVVSQLGEGSELIVVDDGSSDCTAELAERAGAQVVVEPENRGYGAALKAGIVRAVHDTIVITDADGTYPAAAIPGLLEFAGDYDMVVGSREGENVSIPAIRRPAKWVLKHLASYLAGRRIPDLNSGLRVMRRSLIEQYAHLLPQGFSFTTTITLAALCGGHLVHYHPIDYYARVGDSKIRAFHAAEFLLLVLRTVVYFNPLKVFLPLGGILFAGGLAKFIYDLFIGNLSETALLGFLGGAMLWALGLLSDQISKLALRGSLR
ncbi:MAG: glycosyltransferase family 2 protein [Myxococcota bacterium]